MKKMSERLEGMWINQTYKIFIEMFGHLPKDDIDFEIWNMIFHRLVSQ